MDNGPDCDSEENHMIFLNHVVLPRFLPQIKSEHLHGEELALISCMVHNVVQNVELANNVPPNTVKMLRGFDEMHRTLTPDVVSGQISELKPGEIFAMFVRSQNCAVMIHMPLNQSDRVIVATFPGYLDPKHVSDEDSDIQVYFDALKIYGFN